MVGWLVGVLFEERREGRGRDGMEMEMEGS